LQLLKRILLIIAHGLVNEDELAIKLVLRHMVSHCIGSL
jgi:hypothetical protein